MLKKPSALQTELEIVSLESLVPPDHLLRKIDAVIDFSFIHALVEDLYCPDNGRPPLDPTLMFKALFVGYLFAIRSERQLVREIEVNVAYRWFLRLKEDHENARVLAEGIDRIPDLRLKPVEMRTNIVYFDDVVIARRYIGPKALAKRPKPDAGQQP